MKELHKEILIKTKEAIQVGDKYVLDSIRKSLGIPIPKDELFKVYPELKEKYDALGNSPISEPKLAESDGGSIDLYTDTVSEVCGINFDLYELEDVFAFSGYVYVKVNSLEDEFGNTKVTEATKSMLTVKHTLSKIMINILEEKQNLLSKAYAYYDDKVYTPIEYSKEIERINSEYNPMLMDEAIKLRGLDASTLTDWEKNLVLEDTTRYISSSINRGKTAFRGGV